MALRDRVLDNRPLLGGIAVAAAWLALSAVFGGVTILDVIVVVVILVCFAVPAALRKRRSAPKDGSLYGPPE